MRGQFFPLCITILNALLVYLFPCSSLSSLTDITLYYHIQQYSNAYYTVIVKENKLIGWIGGLQLHFIIFIFLLRQAHSISSGISACW